MAEDLEDATARVVPYDHGVVAKRMRLVVGGVPNLGQVLNSGPRQRQRRSQIMITNDQVLSPQANLVASPLSWHRTSLGTVSRRQPRDQTWVTDITYLTRDDAQRVVFEYIEVFYTPQTQAHEQRHAVAR